MRDVEVPNWLKALPLAPEFRPTDTEFADPIAYISKIEKQASAFGICKVIPPLPKPSKKYVISNLNKSLAKCPELGPNTKLPNNEGDEGTRAVFTTRQQELGQSKKMTRKQVWQSGEVYTLDQFESKSRVFARSQLGDVRDISSLRIEALFWERACDKPIYIDYANDVPGSGFGEPIESCRYLNNRRRRRRRTFRRNCGGSCEIVVKPQSGGTDDDRNNKDLSVSTCVASSNKESEMEGSAGWKLSNSPWNLQVIARSSGSLTRYMPDDIPGVTSPMVYIGMLYSWFAWHVEDHELHSMNFLHTGSPKTWYAVPGENAFAFEEVVRNQAYGPNIDRLAALTMLGEKTTLLSPEVIIDAGIPCCRLVQNPGEFVVTFPRAYHVGFSHGFNCGEAANFGTPKWLGVAKEAAVRRAAMNYLPMLSHQQLLYLLTMSFVSRVPRSLLPGARSSRMRDRQKDERELSIKKAFLDDISNENKLLTTLLRKLCSTRVVLWDLESLPSSTKVPVLCTPSDMVVTTPKVDISSENKISHDLLSDMSLYMENVNDLYMDDDLSGDFQLDSGSLACVACGILGFPFMSVVQPSERASVNLLQEVGASKPEHSCSSSLTTSLVVELNAGGVDENVKGNEGNILNLSDVGSQSAILIKSMGSFSENPSTNPDPFLQLEATIASDTKFEKGCCPTRDFSRPRLFCLEHAMQVVSLLHPKGGANVLVICHSDFKKMKAHAAVIREQIGNTLKYNEVPLDNASQEDLNLIELAIDDEEHDESGKDWTAKLCINLRHCLKVRKGSLSIPEHPAVALSGLFFGTDLSSVTFDLKWLYRKSRSKCNLKKPSEAMRVEKRNTTDSIQQEKGKSLGLKSEASITQREGKLIQYSRRSFKCKLENSIANETAKKQVHEASAAGSDPNENVNVDISPKDLIPNTESIRKEGFRLDVSTFNRMSESQQGSGVPVSSHAADSISPGTQNAEIWKEKSFPEGVRMKVNCNDSTRDDIEAQPEMKVDGISEKVLKYDAENSGSSLVITVEDPQHLKIDREIKCMDDTSVIDVGFISEDLCLDGVVSVKEVSGVVCLAPFCCSGSVTARYEVQREEKEVKSVNIVAVESENIEAVDWGGGGDNQCINEDKDEEPVPSDGAQCFESCLVLNEGNVEVSTTHIFEDTCSDSSHPLFENGEPEKSNCLTMVAPRSKSKDKRKRNELELQFNAPRDIDGFIRSPCEGLRPRSSKHAKRSEICSHSVLIERPVAKKSRKPPNSLLSYKDKKKHRKASHKCDIENCRMSFHTKEDLHMHKRNQCPYEGCRKKFRSHKYAVLHQRVHDDDRPLKCPWKGCEMSFKWAWARIEHIRLHTGERPYHCKIEGCGLTFRFVSDYSRHRRKTGHYVTSPT